MRLYSLRNKHQNIIYKGKLPSWLEKYDKKYHNLLRSLKSRNWVNIVYYIKILLKQDNNNINNTYNIITQFENLKIKNTHNNI